MRSKNNQQQIRNLKGLQSEGHEKHSKSSKLRFVCSLKNNEPILKIMAANQGRQFLNPLNLLITQSIFYAGTLLQCSAKV